MRPEQILVRPADNADRRALAALFAEVAAERDKIAAEPPIDVEGRAAGWDIDGTLVALIAERIVGLLFVVESSYGVGELGMLVAADARGRGVGSALLARAIDRARRDGRLHKLALSVFPHNDAAIALYRRFGFVVEGRRTGHVRRTSGEFWDLLELGRRLDDDRADDDRPGA